MWYVQVCAHVIVGRLRFVDLPNILFVDAEWFDDTGGSSSRVDGCVSSSLEEGPDSVVFSGEGRSCFDMRIGRVRTMSGDWILGSGGLRGGRALLSPDLVCQLPEVRQLSMNA